jgi:hypothetical protein
MSSIRLFNPCFAEYNRGMDESSSPSPLFCDRCSKEIHPGRADFYVVRIEAIADPTPPEFTLEDLERDHRAEFARLCESLQNLSEREALEQVYRRLTIFLCHACYAQWIENPAG